MPNFGWITSFIEEILKLIFGDQVPPWIRPLVGCILAFAFVLWLVWILLLGLSKITELWANTIWPLFYNAEEKRRSVRRRRFADHIESEIRRLNNLEEWRDYRFTELEAEVEAEGRRREFGALPFLQRTRSGLRRERSLSRALESSQERLILLEGEPGSGKSVALRHVAQAMAHHAMKARSTNSVIPLYINLKGLNRRPGEAIDKELIRSYVLGFLNRVNDRDIEEFLEEEFDRGLQEGTWLFLFDSFDEIPEVLSSTEVDTAIRSYGDAISDFLHGMNQCRGVVASRRFRGPGQFGWPRFRILPLSEARRLELIHRAELKPELERELMGQLGMARQEIRSMASNPMFLGLLCEHMRAGHPFPENVHSVFETYIKTRLIRDKDRLQRRFELKLPEVRAAAESVAFCMAADPGLGLSPTRESLKDAMVRMGFEVRKDFDTLLDALEYIKLARSETATAVGESKPFTFAHRRFQEYFATCVVLREPDRVSPRQLLTDARWRETAVTMCQTQPPEVLSPIVEEARRLLTEIVDSVPGLIDKPLEYVRVSASTDQGREVEGEESLPEPFPWPSGALHILGLLQDGFGGRLKELPDDIRMYAGRLVLSASETGTLSDKKWGLEVAGIVAQPILLHMLRDAFASQSQWLKEVAYRQAARLGKIPADIASWIRQALVNLAITGRLRRERHATHAHLSRLDQSSAFLSTERLLLWVPFVDLGLHTIAFFTLLTKFIRGSPFTPLHIAWIIVLITSHLSFRRASRPGWHFICFLIRLSFIMLFVIAVVLWYIGEIPSTVLLNSLLYSYAAIWAPLALLSARTGQYTHPLWWPLIPILLPLLYLVRNARVVPIAILAWLRKYWKIAGISLLLTVGLSILIENVPALSILIVTLEAAPVLVFIWVGLIAAVRWVQDWVRWRKWVRSHRASMTAHELLELVSQYHHRTFRNRLVRAVREQGLLIVAEDTETLVNRLALAVEQAILIRKRTLEEIQKRWWSARSMKLIVIDIKHNITDLKTRPRKVERLSLERVGSIPSASDFFDLWLTEYTKKDERRLSKLGPEFLDEVCMLLEQVRASRRDRY